MKRLMLLLFVATPAFAQAIAPTPRGIVVAHHNEIQLFNAAGTDVVWTTGGVANPTSIVAGDDRVAVLDALSSGVRIVEFASGRGATVKCGETPVGGVFVGRTLYLLERDARALERVGADGARASINIAADPQFLRQARGRLYVYARAAGVLQEITAAPFAIARSVGVAPFASDFQTDGTKAYFVYPREAKIRVVALATMKPAGEIAVGAVPVALAIASSHTLAVADPSAKRVWTIEGSQSFSQAFARGFLRGLLGLGIRPARNSDFSTGVDRVLVRGNLLLAYDTSSATLYRVAKAKSSIVAKDVPPQAFTATSEGVFVWDDAVRRLQRYSNR
ncbi:MAG TPA: hypothetical protein VEO74_05270 [Thermoanaerobaculia bacterium]|nr:hypothetical protein [Thermoanaerobaculia bacterium]